MLIGDESKVSEVGGDGIEREIEIVRCKVGFKSIEYGELVLEKNIE